MRTKLPALLFGIVLVSGPKTFALFAQSSSQPTQIIPSRSWGDAVNGVQMSIFQDPTFQGTNAQMHLMVAFRNAGQSDETFVTSGFGCAHPPPDSSSAVKINLTDEQGVSHRHLPYLGDGPPWPGLGACAGVPNPVNFVALHPGETNSMPLSLGKYLDLSDSQQYGVFRFHAGTYSLQVELSGTDNWLVLIPKTSPLYSTFKATVWTGTVKSNILQIHFDSEFVALFGDLPK